MGKIPYPGVKDLSFDNLPMLKFVYLSLSLADIKQYHGLFYMTTQMYVGCVMRISDKNLSINVYHDWSIKKCKTCTIADKYIQSI